MWCGICLLFACYIVNCQVCYAAGQNRVSTNTHTRTHTHTPLHTSTRPLTRKHTYTNHLQLYTNTNTHTYTCTHTFVLLHHACRCTAKLAPSLARIPSTNHTQTHTYHIYMHTHAHLCAATPCLQVHRKIGTVTGEDSFK
jgi:hypothetical protein